MSNNMSNKIKILIIDDVPLILKTTRMLLQKAGFEVETAATPDEGMGKWNSWKPDCVLLDLMLPEKNGWDILEEMRSRKSHVDIPVFIYSAKDDPAELRKAQTMKVAGFFLKPFDTSTMIVKIKKAVEESRADSLSR